MRIEIHKHAQEDLDLLFEEDPDEWADIYTLLQELQSNEYLSENLYDEWRHYDFPAFETKKYLKLFKSGLNAYRLKALERKNVPRYRILYACDNRATKNTAYILAVVNRDFDYETDHTIVKRFIEDYKDLGIPEYKDYY